jgi:hypothetical protein
MYQMARQYEDTRKRLKYISKRLTKFEKPEKQGERVSAIVPEKVWFDGESAGDAPRYNLFPAYFDLVCSNSLIRLFIPWY